MLNSLFLGEIPKEEPKIEKPTIKMKIEGSSKTTNDVEYIKDSVLCIFADDFQTHSRAVHKQTFKCIYGHKEETNSNCIFDEKNKGINHSITDHYGFFTLKSVIEDYSIIDKTVNFKFEQKIVHNSSQTTFHNDDKWCYYVFNRIHPPTGEFEYKSEIEIPIPQNTQVFSIKVSDGKFLAGNDKIQILLFKTDENGKKDEKGNDIYKEFKGIVRERTKDSSYFNEITNNSRGKVDFISLEDSLISNSSQKNIKYKALIVYETLFNLKGDGTSSFSEIKFNWNFIPDDSCDQNLGKLFDKNEKNWTELKWHIGEYPKIPDYEKFVGNMKTISCISSNDKILEQIANNYSFQDQIDFFKRFNALKKEYNDKIQNYNEPRILELKSIVDESFYRIEIAFVYFYIKNLLNLIKKEEFNILSHSGVFFDMFLASSKTSMIEEQILMLQSHIINLRYQIQGKKFDDASRCFKLIEPKQSLTKMIENKIKLLRIFDENLFNGESKLKENIDKVDKLKPVDMYEEFKFESPEKLKDKEEKKINKYIENLLKYNNEIAVYASSLREPEKLIFELFQKYSSEKTPYDPKMLSISKDSDLSETDRSKLLEKLRKELFDDFRKNTLLNASEVSIRGNFIISRFNKLNKDEKIKFGTDELEKILKEMDDIISKNMKYGFYMSFFLIRIKTILKIISEDMGNLSSDNKHPNGSIK